MEFRQCHMPHMLYIDEELNKHQKKQKKYKEKSKMATNQQMSGKAKHPRQNMTLCRASGNAAEVASQRITSASSSEPN